MASNPSFINAGSTKSGSHLNDFTNTFVFSSESSTSKNQVLSEVPKALSVDLDRQRRAHRKSGSGCDNCKRRRVKCNEETPCANCSRRGERCSRATRSNRIVSVPRTSGPVTTLTPGFGPTDAVVNLHHMKLFHHFETYTQHTLMLTPEVWEHAIRLSFHFDFLMNVILCVAARHLAFLQPENTSYSRAAASHLSRALPRFRYELSNNFILTHIDAFISTSLLLQYEAWASTDISFPQNDDIVSLDPTRDRVFAMGSSLKEVFLKSLPLLADQPSKFLPLLQYNPADKLVAVGRINDSTVAKYLDFFSYDNPLDMKFLNPPPPCPRSKEMAPYNPWRHCIPHSQSEPDLDPIADGYAPVIARLCIILSFLPEAQPPNDDNTEPNFFSDLARYVLSFPIACYGPFSPMIQKGDPRALSLLYHFYRAARILLPRDECWWAQKRAALSENNLKEWLTKEITKQVDR
ncbi:uncharacterized protein F4822DRAFT_192467 [Hypoxylon trugodes]|uniref:uncharacterized protein n=1 Tax=Hypoxylon trugodes TaxID=326681 RepID=UPI00219F0788|nr:uncharacterized protein F4822DRAFT_192467 [Hypoxylon trugodes]KAI1391658.1 hypothetical protein F4822DRAFT_192467 [Hypoxylon trugodes]